MAGEEIAAAVQSCHNLTGSGGGNEGNRCFFRHRYHRRPLGHAKDGGGNQGRHRFPLKMYRFARRRTGSETGDSGGAYANRDYVAEAVEAGGCEVGNGNGYPRPATSGAAAGCPQTESRQAAGSIGPRGIQAAAIGVVQNAER